MTTTGVLSSSLYRIVTGHAKCDALLAALAYVAPEAATSECHSLPASFSAHEFQRHALPPASADRRSLKGSYFVPLAAVRLLLRSRTPFFARDTAQRALLDQDGHVAASFDCAAVVRDTSKRAAAASARLASAAEDQAPIAHWNSLRALLLAVEAAGPQQPYIEIPPCPCASCRKHVDPRAAVRLLLFPFEPETTLLSVVSSRRRGKPLPPAKKAADSGDEQDEHLPAIFHITSTPMASDADAPLVTPPPPLAVPPPPALPAAMLPPTLFRFQDESLLKSQIDAAVADATAAITVRYEYRLVQSQNEVCALRQQVDQLQRQLQLLSIGAASTAASTASGTASTPFDSDLPLDDMASLTLSTAAFSSMSPPRKRRQQPTGAFDSLCRDMAWLELPPHSPSQHGLFV